MKNFINSNTVANTIRMGARSRRPKAVFLATDQTDMTLMKILVADNKCRIIQAHSSENAAKAIEILAQVGWEGVFTVVNSGFEPPTEQDILGHNGDPMDGVGIEGMWEEVRNCGDLLSGKRVRVTTLDQSYQENRIDRSNTTMLEALSKIDDILKGMNPRPSGQDYLREARGGAMYGIVDDN